MLGLRYRNLQVLGLLIGIFFLSSCQYDTVEDLFPDRECNTEGVSYLRDVLPVLELNCIVCHSQSVAEAGIILEGYNNLRIWIDNGRVEGSIKQQTGFIPMPPLGYELSACEIEKIVAWINQGAPEN